VRPSVASCLWSLSYKNIFVKRCAPEQNPEVHPLGEKNGASVGERRSFFYT
jgi:hypothetical protein